MALLMASLTLNLQSKQLALIPQNIKLFLRRKEHCQVMKDSELLY